MKRMSRLRNTIEQCLTSFKHTVRSHNKLQQVVQLEAPFGHGQFLYAVCSSILKSSRLQKDNIDSVRKAFCGHMIRSLFQDINLRNKTTVHAVICHSRQANGGLTKLFEPC
jgi:hypothetical protein